jgi:hypothetical protein
MKKNIEIAIFERYEKICQERGWRDVDRLDLSLTLSYANKDCPLDMEKLLAFPDFDFVHDVTGMLNNMNRRTCKLENCFLPRCAKSK